MVTGDLHAGRAADSGAPRVGLCGWTIAQASYVAQFPMVEVQQTFYEPPSDAVLRRWRTSTPAAFEFTVKAWQLVTHDPTSPTYRRLKHPIEPGVRADLGAFRLTPPVIAAWDRTLHCARLLRATAVLLQCPRSFRPDADAVARLRRFIQTVPRPEGQLLWEPRGEWPDQLVAELCSELALVHVVDPMQRESVTPETYFRLHGTSGSRHVHTIGELERVRELIRGKHRPYVLFNNLPRVGDATRFIDLLQSDGLAPLASSLGRSRSTDRSE